MPRAARPAPLPGHSVALRRLAPALLLAVVVAAGCGPRHDDATTAAGGAAPERVENPALGIALVGPGAAGFELVANQGDTLELVRPARDGEPAATLSYQAGLPQIAGVNLVAAVNDQKAQIEARPGGKFFGQVQLMSQLGNAFSTRGRYSGEDGAETEEIKIFAVHPSGDRLLWLTYVYPPTTGATKERVDQAMAALGLIEALPAPPAEPAAAVPSEGG